MIGERLRAARGRSRKTLRDVASACGVSPQAVKKWEDGTAMPTSGKLIALCRLLDCSMEWIMDGPLDFHSTPQAPQGVHAKYWVREAIAELKEQGVI
jgi:transcriptional regulator with XRE-family HTH domain